MVRFGSLMGNTHGFGGRRISRLRTPFVIRPFGRITWLCLYNWGASMETLNGYLVLTWRHGWSLYWSRDGTPHSAKWKIGQNYE